MQVIRARNVHEALPEAVRLMGIIGRSSPSRNGEVLVSPEPVTTVYERPRERVVFWPQRDANPFFHLYEALWMVGGRNDVGSLTRFVQRMGDFSDDGKVFHGAYGFRWRQWFQIDQLKLIAEALKADPNNRRQVLQMWDCRNDLPLQEELRDVPCNLVVHFQLHLGALDMTVFCRSNDIVWGCYGANAVHFSVLQEVIAAWIGTPVGKYWHVSDNWHAYLDSYEQVRGLADCAAQPMFSKDKPPNPYDGWVTPFPMVSVSIEQWMEDLDVFLSAEGRVMGYRDPFFRHVALPMMAVHDTFKSMGQPERYEVAIARCERIKADDWRMACEQWLERRLTAWRNRTITP